MRSAFQLLRNMLCLPSVLNIVFLFACIHTSVFSQEPGFRHFTTREGMPSMEAYQIIQDNEGLIWIATDAGLCKYDGYSFENITAKNQNKPDNVILKIHKDGKGRIWMIGYNGGIAFAENDIITEIPCNNKLKNDPQMVSSIYVDEKNVIWLSYYSNTILAKKISPPYGENDIETFKSEVSGNYPYLFSVDSKNVLSGYYYDYSKSILSYVRYAINGKAKLSVRASKSHQYAYSQPFPVRPRVCEKNRNVFVTLGKTLFRLDSNNQLQTYWDNTEYNLSLLNTTDQLIWASTYKDGVFCFDPSLPATTPKLRVLRHRIVTSVFCDRNNGYWFSTLDDGIYYVSSLSTFYHNFQDSDLSSGIPVDIATNGKVVCINTVGDEYMLIDSAGNLCKIRKDNNTGLTAYFQKHGNSDPIINSQSNNLLFSKNRFDFDPSKTYFFDTYTDKQNVIWIHGVEGPDEFIWRLYPKSDKPEIYFRKKRGGYRVSQIVVQPEKNCIWLNTTVGLLLIRNKKEEWLAARHPQLAKRIYRMTLDNEGRLIIGTKGNGVQVIHNSVIYQIGLAEGLPDLVAPAVEFDSIANKVWIGTSVGLSSVEWMNGKPLVRNYQLEYGIVKGNTFSICCMNKKVYGLSNKDVYIYDYSNDGPSPEYMSKKTSVWLNNKLLPVSDRNAIVGHDFKEIRFDFQVTCFNCGSGLVYDYMLEGIDNEWHHTSERSVSYFSLKPGEYVFVVRVSSVSGSPAEILMRYPFSVRAPFWKHIWFWPLILVVFFSILSFGIYRSVQIKRKRLELISQVELQIANMRLNALQAQMNPHFIFNAINSIQSFILKKNIEEAHHYLSHFARLIRLVLNNSRTEKISLAAELDTIKYYVDLEKLRLRNPVQYIVNVSAEVDVLNTEIPPMLLQPYIENAIWHGIMPLKSTGLIEVNISADKGRLIIRIDDNGIGRVAAGIMSQKKVHSSVAMGINKERLEIMERVYKIDNQVVITDKYDVDNNALGTSVYISIPLMVTQ